MAPENMTELARDFLKMKNALLHKKGISDIFFDTYLDFGCSGV